MQPSETLPTFVDLNVLPEELRPWPYQRLFMLGVLALLAASLLLIPLYRAERAADDKTAGLRAELSLIGSDLARVQADLGKVRELQRQLEAVETELADLNKERQAIIGDGQELSGDFSAAVSALPPGASLNSVAAGDELMTLAGQAPGPEDVFLYARTLERGQKFSEARVTSLVSKGGEAGNPVVTFTIEAVR